MDPFDNFEPEKADKLLAYSQSLFNDETTAHAYLILAAVALCPHDEYNREFMDLVISAVNSGILH